ncbi:ferredoxin-2, mitochondrial-like [Panonychus citri]|uniref:ferredoxin-2, mitochondrial-like n=1 Tax=Panonychus citri TaxID=50023 RepID=UPI00230720CF|nr:ferredoxin-2, mitochondrial-like [Panonychus citri]
MNFCLSILLTSVSRSRMRIASYCSSVKNSNLTKVNKENGGIHVTYITKECERITIKGKLGDNVMYLAHSNDIPIEGACEASLACCTCHVYVNDEFFDKLPTPDEREDDMLDMAPFLKTNSRLSCQIILTDELDGIEVTLPPATRNFYVDGKKPTPH